MDYSNALRQAIAEVPPKWGFSTWDYQTELACSAEEREAIQQYGVEVRRRAYEIVRELQDHREAAEARQAEHKQRHEQNGREHRPKRAMPHHLARPI